MRKRLIRLLKQFLRKIPTNWRAERTIGGIVSWELDGMYQVEINYNHGFIFRVWDVDADRAKDSPVIHYFTNGFNSMEEGVRNQSPVNASFAAWEKL